MENNIRDDFDLTCVESGYKYKIWVKALNNKGTNKRKFMEKVLQDAEEGKIVSLKGGLYYSCARFIKKYHKSYTFVKTSHEYITCCYAYPKVCGGVCCFDKNRYVAGDGSQDDGCGCGRLPRNKIHLRNCYDDCCNIVRIKSKRKFDLSWRSKDKI